MADASGTEPARIGFVESNISYPPTGEIDC